MKAEHLLISRRVQGVGYRAWLVGEATQRSISGWVRNLGTGQVEAVICGDSGQVDELARLCETGPRFANVTHVQRTGHAPPPDQQFRYLASA